MSRWDYDTVFYRVFCTALLGVALTFTVILTNVFIDIDGLLTTKNTGNKNKQETIKAETEDDVPRYKPDIYDYKDYSDSYAVERTKRSLETQDFSFHIKDPKMKKVITNRLTALLEDLDREEFSKTTHKNEHEIDIESKDKHNQKSLEKVEKYTKIDFENSHNDNKVKASIKGNIELLDKGKKSIENDDIEILNDIKRIKNEKKQKLNHTEDELKHLAIHNIILQGIIGHMDLGDVYGKVHALINNINAPEVKDSLKEILNPEPDKEFFNELTNCKELKDQIIGETAKTETRKVLQTMENKIQKLVKPTGRNVMIKTIIDITSRANDKTNQNDASSKENVNGIVQLIYNGKSLKFRRIDDDLKTSKTILKTSTEPIKPFANHVSSNIENIKETEDKMLNSNKLETYVPNMYMKKMINEYLKRFSKDDLESLNNNTKRLKRHVKILYENEESTKTTTEKPKKGDKGEDELYVEIETHFDSKGLKGEKKKQMIRELVEKIQKAIHSEKEVKKKKHKHMHVKKRAQSSLDSESTVNFASKIMMPLNSLIHRDLDPISKSVPLHEKLPHMSDNKGDEWKRTYNGPRFLSASKTINSAELNELVTDYSKTMDNGIPQRLQKPLNTDTIDETSILNNAQDQGNANIIVKNIAGSGFSIGFNQYVDEPPDAESMKLFTGIENIIQTYHQKYDEDANAENTNAALVEDNYNLAKQWNNENLAKHGYATNFEQPANEKYAAPGTNDHLIVRRSIKKDYHSNEYKVIFNKNFLNYKNYEDIYNKGQYSVAKNSKTRNMNSALVDDIFNKNLKPAEIFNLADLLERQKRSLNVKKISNIKSKKKLNRYLNTKSMASKKIFQQNKRSKRQINKIRIIAKDLSKNHKHNSEEEVFVMSDEKVFADRAIVKEVETPAMDPSENVNEEHYDVMTPQKPAKEHHGNQNIHEEHYDIVSPHKENANHYDIISPYIFDTPSIETSNTNNFFTKKSRHNLLMSKYPHIFMEEITRSKEDFIEDSPYLYGNVIDKVPTELPTQTASPIVELPEPRSIPEPKFNNPDIQDIVDHYPPQDKSNYKVTVKIMPKNNTGLNSGFKEIHTSINKSYNKNGLVYTSLVNVSEISKVEKINKTKESNEISHPSVKKLKRQQLKVKSMIQQHKDRIEEQLAHLNKEREKLDRIDIRNTDILKDAPKDYVDVALPTNPARTLHLTKEDLSRLFNFEDSTTTKQPSTTIMTTTEHIEPEIKDTDRIKIINTIERNENITNEILKKIDKNTDILQTFLFKLISKMEGPKETTQKPEENSTHYDTVSINVNKYEEQPKNSYPQVPRTNEMYNQNIPNIFFNPKDMYKNGSAGIPFVYAFQRPYTMQNSDDKNVPMASVVYQGHIHTKTVHNKAEVNRREDWKEKEDNVRKEQPDKKPVNNESRNSTKFFIDDLENDYKVLPILGKSVYPGILNSTKAVKP